MGNLTDLKDKVLAAVRSLPDKAKGSDAVRAALGQARELEALAASEVDAAKAAIRAALETFDMDRGAEARERLNDAEFAAQAACVSVQKLEAELAAEERREDQERRKAAFAAARKEIDAVEKQVRKAYPELAGGIVKIVENLARSEGLVREANANLPDGEAPLFPLSERLFSHALPREDVSSERVSCWADEGTGERIEEPLDRSVQDLGGGRGVLPHREAGSAAITPHQPGAPNGRSVVRRDFWMVTFRRHVAGGHSADDGFASRLHLPALAHQEPFWTPSFDDRPEVVLEHLETVRARQADARKLEERRLEVEFVPIREPAPAEA